MMNNEAASRPTCLSTQALGFGTGLRTFLLKTIINRFLYAKTPSAFESFHIDKTKKQHLTMLFFVLSG